VHQELLKKHAASHAKYDLLFPHAMKQSPYDYVLNVVYDYNDRTTVSPSMYAFKWIRPFHQLNENVMRHTIQKDICNCALRNRDYENALLFFKQHPASLCTEIQHDILAFL
jgi:hypothetical protein